MNKLNQNPQLKNHSLNIYSKEDIMKFSLISLEKQSNNSANKILIKMCKNNSDGEKGSKSLIVIKTKNKKISFNLIEDQKFFQSIQTSSKLNQFKDELNTIGKSQTFCECETKKNSIKNNIDLASLQIKRNNQIMLLDDIQRNLNLNGNNSPANNSNVSRNMGNLKFHVSATYSRIKTFPLIKAQYPIFNDSQGVSNDFLLLTKHYLLEKDQSHLKDNLILELLNKTNTFNQYPNLNVSHSKKQLEKNDKTQFPQNYTICELCDFLTPITFMKTFEPCNHLFCKRCGKHYYEDKIELGESEFKCLYYSCTSQIKEEMLYELISKNHLDRLFRLRNNSLFPSNNKSTYNTTTCEPLPKAQSTFFTTIKDYNKKHVIDISQNDNTFLLYHKFKENICNKCNLPSLFGKNYSNTLKCLNCFGRFCKYCLQVIDSLDHFNTNSERCCKSYKRFFIEQSLSQTQKNRSLFYLEQFFFFCLSYLILLIAGIILINNFAKAVFSLQKKQNKINTHETLKTIQNFSFYSQTVCRSYTRSPQKKKCLMHLRDIARRVTCVLIIIILSLIYSILVLLLLAFYPVLYCILETVL